mmetsp:Transcript_97586/g.142798  ORF Transcript_97586/g.142798 Transcript_97586/m.142798 type:complete len:112 (+) Transcript_97586:160-495(+)
MHFLNPPPFYCLNSPKRGIRKVQMPDLYLVMRMVPRRAPRPAAGSGRAGRGLAPGAGRAGAAGVEAIERRPPRWIGAEFTTAARGAGAARAAGGAGAALAAGVATERRPPR